MPVRCILLSDSFDIFAREIYDIRGFLCVDCKGVTPDWDREMEKYHLFNIIAMYADALYILTK